MSRLAKFNTMKNDPWLGRLFNKLTSEDIEICKSFICANDHLDKCLFEMAVNRMFLDKDKPKNWKLISELIASTN